MFWVTVIVLGLAGVNGQGNIRDYRVDPYYDDTPKPYAFSYSAPLEDGIGESSRTESADGTGRVSGSYTVRNDEGHFRVVDYIADEAGFRANVRTNEPGTDGSQSPADVTMVTEHDVPYPYRPAVGRQVMPYVNRPEVMPYVGRPDVMPYAGRQVVPYAGRQVVPYAGRQVVPYAGRQVVPHAGRQVVPYVGHQNTVPYVGRQVGPYVGRQDVVPYVGTSEVVPEPVVNTIVPLRNTVYNSPTAYQRRGMGYGGVYPYPNAVY